MDREVGMTMPTDSILSATQAHRTAQAEFEAACAALMHAGTTGDVVAVAVA